MRAGAGDTSTVVDGVSCTGVHSHYTLFSTISYRRINEWCREIIPTGRDYPRRDIIPAVFTSGQLAIGDGLLQEPTDEWRKLGYINLVCGGGVFT